METTIDINEKQIFLDLFKGREDYFAVQTIDIYKPVKKRFSEYYLDQHLKKLVTFGIYVLTKESKCNFICIDIDIPKGDFNSVNFENKSEKFNYLKSELLEIETILKEKLEIDSDAILFEDTGGRGYHIWLFYENQITGEDAIKFYNILKSYVGFSFEYFPKQPNLNKQRKLGNLVKLPLGIHQRYKSESSFFTIDDTKINLFQNLEENFIHLKSIKKIKVEKIIDIIEKEKDKIAPVQIPEIQFIKELESDRVLYTDDLDFLFKNCNALNNIKKKAESGVAISYNEAFHLVNILLSVNVSENILLELIKISYGAKFSYDKTQKEIDRIRCLHPTSCKKLIYQNICEGYCQPEIEKTNLDNLLPDTTPLSAWLFPIKKATKIEDHEIHEKICELNNIRNAYFQLKKYHKKEDALFFDEFDFDGFEKHLEINLSHISRILANKEDFPLVGYLIVDLPKKVDENQVMQYRPMAYSTIYDQVIIQAIFNIISIILERNFEDSSFGYRYNIENLEGDEIFNDWKEYYPKFKNMVLDELSNPLNTHYVCCDIKGYYDHIDHEILIQQIRQHIRDDYIVKLVEKFILIYEIEEGAKKGIPQGPAYARILANLYLNDFDKEIKQYASGYYRYVDDFFLFFDSRVKAEEGLKKVNAFLANLGLLLSDDEKKRTEIKETIDDEKIIDTIDRLKYGIFEEFKFIDYLEIDEIINFYKSVEHQQVSPKNYDEILEINNLLPSILYLISKNYSFPLPLKDKIPKIIQFLVQNNVFYPKRLKSIFFQIIELMKEQDINIVSFFQNLHDTHKIYFLLCLFGIFTKHRKYFDDLSEIIKKGIHSDNSFLVGFSIIIYNKLDIEGISLEKEYFENILSSEIYFSKIKLYNSIDYFNLADEIKQIFRRKLNHSTPYIERKNFLLNIKLYHSIHVDDLFLRGLLSSDFIMLLPEGCSLFSKIQSHNLLFKSLHDNISNLVNFKDLSIDFLIAYIYKSYSDGGIAGLMNLNELANEITDFEIRREVKNTIKRIKDVNDPGDDAFSRTHSIISRYNESFLYKNESKEKNNYDYLEIIPKYKLDKYGFSDLDNFKKRLENLSNDDVLPKVDVEFDSTKNEILIKYIIPENFEEISGQKFSLNNDSIIFSFFLLADIFKKALYFCKKLNFVPLIALDNLLLNTKKKTIIFKHIGSILCPQYTINTTSIRNNNSNEIPLMLSLILKKMFFDFDETEIKKFIQSPKKGVELFLWHFIKRLALQEPSMRYSLKRFNYLINKLAEKDLKSEYKISLFYFHERLKAKLYQNNLEQVQWQNICNSISNFYHELAAIYDSIQFSELNYFNKTLFNYNLPRKLNYLSKLLINISMNIENLFPNKLEEKEGFDLIIMLNYFAVFCIESICFFRAGISDLNKKNFDIDLTGNCVIRVEHYSMQFDNEEIKKLNALFNQLKNKKDVFDGFIKFDFKLLVFIYLACNFELLKKDNEITIERNYKITKKNFESLALNLLVRIPNIETQVKECVCKVLAALKTNQEFELSEKENKLNESIINLSFDLLEIMKIFGFKRYFGKNINFSKWPPDLHCKSRTLKTFKANTRAFSKIPLINKYPATYSRCSWDAKEKKVVNIVIPNERINKLISKLKKGKIFGLKLGFLYSERAKLLWDTAILIVLIPPYSYFTYKFSTGISGDYYYLEIVNQILLLPAIIFFIHKSFKDIKYWSKKADNILNSLSSYPH